MGTYLLDSGEKPRAGMGGKKVWKSVGGWLRVETSEVGEMAQWHQIADEMRKKLRIKCWGLLNGRIGKGSWAGKEMEILLESLEEPRDERSVVQMKIFWQV